MINWYIFFVINFFRECVMQPRLVRLRDAPTYLGMDRNRLMLKCGQHLLKSQ